MQQIDSDPSLGQREKVEWRLSKLMQGSNKGKLPDYASCQCYLFHSKRNVKFITKVMRTLTLACKKNNLTILQLER